MSDKIVVKVIEPNKEVETITPPKVKDTQYKEGKIYIRSVQGIFTALRQKLNWILMLSFFLLPWVPYGDRQAVLFDLGAQKFHIFGLIIWPQDLVLLAVLLMIAAYALFLVTTFVGRVWCGFTCPQTIWTFIFVWVEEKVEGKVNKRKSLDKQPSHFQKIWKKTLKHSIWLFISLITSLTFLAFFVPVKQLYLDFFTLNATSTIYFWTVFFTFCTYGNAGWMREIMCLHMCPYARFQSAMFDKDTFSVAYDATRGENRGPRSRKKDHKELGLGDCIDCNLCVQVCPTGIDIRDGLQYECINCGACIDACDDVMDKMGYERKLISYTTENQLEGKKTHILRSKLVGYGSVLLIMVVVFVYFLMNIQLTKLDIIRDRNQLYRISSEGMLENVYTLKVLNKTEHKLTYTLSFSGLDDFIWLGRKTVTVEAGEVFTLPMSISTDPYNLKKRSVDVSFSANAISNNGEAVSVTAESKFFNEF